MKALLLLALALGNVEVQAQNGKCCEHCYYTGACSAYPLEWYQACKSNYKYMTSRYCGFLGGEMKCCNHCKTRDYGCGCGSSQRNNGCGCGSTKKDLGCGCGKPKNYGCGCGNPGMLRWGQNQNRCLSWGEINSPALQYCNKHYDLKNKYCGGKTCTTSTQAKNCFHHYEQSGRSQGRAADPYSNYIAGLDIKIKHELILVDSNSHGFNGWGEVNCQGWAKAHAAAVGALGIDTFAGARVYNALKIGLWEVGADAQVNGQARATLGVAAQASLNFKCDINFQASIRASYIYKSMITVELPTGEKTFSQGGVIQTGKAIPKDQISTTIDPCEYVDQDYSVSSNVYAVTKSSTFKKCLLQCKNDVRCWAVAYTTNAQNCKKLDKAGAASKRKPQPGTISAPKFCSWECTPTGQSPNAFGYYMPYCQGAVAPKCAVANQDWNCCTAAKPCKVGEGGCKGDADCAGSLVCAKGVGQGYNAKSHANFNVCEPKPANLCAVDKQNWSCCSAAKPCAAGEGDCDNDTECAGSLVCGSDNGKNFWASSNGAFDACVAKGAGKAPNAPNSPMLQAAAPVELTVEGTPSPTKGYVPMPAFCRLFKKKLDCNTFQCIWVPGTRECLSPMNVNTTSPIIPAGPSNATAPTPGTSVCGQANRKHRCKDLKGCYWVPGTRVCKAIPNIGLAMTKFPTSAAGNVYRCWEANLLTTVAAMEAECAIKTGCKWNVGASKCFVDKPDACKDLATEAECSARADCKALTTRSGRYVRCSKARSG